MRFAGLRLPEPGTDGWRAAAAIAVAAFLFILPESEALSHILFGASLCLVMLSGPGRGRLDAIDLSLLCFALVPVMSKFTSTISAEVRLSRSTLWIEMAIMAIALRRSGFSSLQRGACIRAAVLGTVFAQCLGATWHGGGFWTHLHSVGHINQVALYFDIALSAALLGVRAERGAWRWIMSACAVDFCGAIWISNSATGVIVMVFIVSLGIVMLPGSRRSSRRWIALGLICACASGTVLLNPKVRGYLNPQVFRQTEASARLPLLRAALAVFPENPWFGTGARSFGEAVSRPRLEAAVLKRHPAFNPDDYKLAWDEGTQRLSVGHGHGLFTTTLVERGLVGILAMAVLLSAWSARLLRGGPEERFLCLAGLAYAIIGGLGNSTLLYEHGWLQLCLWALAEGWPRSLRTAGPVALDGTQAP